MSTRTDIDPPHTTNPFARYLALGWSVIPLQARGKLPESRLLPAVPDASEPERQKRSWKPYQTTLPLPEEVEAWCRHASLNVGIVTGAISGMVVLDLDNHTAIQTAYERGIPTTPTASTGKGLHIYFRYPEVGIGNRANFAEVAGFDLRGEGGYVVAPPSIHPSGRVYEWVIAPEDAPLATIPEWLHQLLFAEAGQPLMLATGVNGTAGEAEDAHKQVEAFIAAELDRLAQAREGGRNDQLNRSAFALGQLIGSGLVSEQESAAQLEAVALQIGLSQSEARATIASGLRAGKRQPKPLADFFPEGESETTTAKRERESQSAALIRLGKQARLFHAPTGETYARYDGGHRHETHLIGHPKSPFRLWLERQFYGELGFTPQSTAMQQALSHLEQVAYFDGDMRQVFTRLGYAGETMYLAIGDKQGHMVALDRTGWRLVQDAPVAFRSTRNAQPLPFPERGGSVDALRPLLNLPDEQA
jgi:hypothetical protein